ncbi:Transcriptional regulator, AraC family [Richelia intracellularis]|nr:Transcriptional regulator, AraC family [Richelia intracellularis]
MIVTTIQNPALQPGWNVTQQWEQLFIRHCRHCCNYGTGENKWNFQDEHNLGLLLSLRPFHFSHRQDNRIYAGLYSKGDVLITPADTTLSTQTDGDVQIIVQIRIKDSFVWNVGEETLGKNSEHIELIQTFQTRDPQIEANAMMLLY